MASNDETTTELFTTEPAPASGADGDRAAAPDAAAPQAAAPVKRAARKRAPRKATAARTTPAHHDAEPVAGPAPTSEDPDAVATGSVQAPAAAARTPRPQGAEPRRRGHPGSRAGSGQEGRAQARAPQGHREEDGRHAAGRGRCRARRRGPAARSGRGGAAPSRPVHPRR